MGEKVKKRKEAEKAIKDSIKKELPKRTRAGDKVPQTIAEAKRRSTWAGKGVLKKTSPKPKVKSPQPSPFPKPVSPSLPKLTPGERLESALARIETQIADEARERLAVLNADGKVLYEKMGTVEEVRVAKSAISKFKDAVTIHNHPSGHSFSPIDIMASVLRKEGRSIVTSSKYRYEINTWNLRRLPVQEILKMEKRYEEIMKELMPKYRRYVRTGVYKRNESLQELSHKIVERLAEEFNFEYKRIAR